MNEKSGDDWVALAAYEISKWAYSRTAGCNLSIDELAAIITKHFPSGDVGKLREALERLASICTCARPSLPNPGGAVVAPGPHTAKCVCTIARAALASVPANPPQVDTALEEIADLFHIGEARKDPNVLLTNIKNTIRRADCLSAIEREFFTGSITDESGEDNEVCLLNWGDTPEQYVEAYRTATAHARKSQPKEGVNQKMLKALEMVQQSYNENEQLSDEDLVMEMVQDAIRAAESAAVPSMELNDYLCIHHNDAEREQLKSPCVICQIAVLKNEKAELAETLRAIVNGALHPDKAVRRVMVDLEPIRAVLAKVDARKEGGK